MWENNVQPDRPQTTIWRMRIACRIPKSTCTHSVYVILLFHYNNGCTNAPQYYFKRTPPVLSVSPGEKPCNKQRDIKLCHVSASRKKSFPAQSLNMVSRNIILSAGRWTESRGIALRTNWNNGSRCFTCRHEKRSASRVSVRRHIKVLRKRASG